MTTRFVLPESGIPTHWYNIQADMPTPMPPPLHPGTRQPATAADFAPIFCEPILEQEMSTARFIKIPDPVREAYALWRPTPLLRAIRLEQALQTTAHIYYKYEGSSPAGSHKPNSAVPQAYYNKLAGVRRLSTETGAGQWGASLALACQMFGIECVVYQVRVSFDRNPYRKMLMNTWGAVVHASPSSQTRYGRELLAAEPDNPGSLGIAISEAIEDAVTHPDTKYALGSVLNHVCMHQTVIGQEALEQMKMAGEYPDVVVGCVGGGSNFSGLSFPFVYRNISENRKTRLLAVEPAVCASLTAGERRYDFGDTAEMTPLMMMYTLGHKFMPPSIHAGGLRYHGMAPTVSHLYHHKLIEAKSYSQTQCFQAAMQFAHTEGLIPAPESSHAVRAAIDEALEAKRTGEKRVILFNLSGHGLLELPAYDAYMTGKLGTSKTTA